MPATLEERYQIHLDARKVYDEQREAALEEYGGLYEKLNDEIAEARQRRQQLDSAYQAAKREADAAYKEVTGVDPDGPF